MSVPMNPMTAHDVGTSTDVDVLWTAFLDARRRGDDELAATIRERMAVLQEERQLRELDDDALLAQIAHLESRKEREEEDSDAVDVTASPPGPVARLSALLEEAARRGM